MSSKRHTHHCPLKSKGNCRNAKSPGNIRYCGAHQYACGIDGCDVTPIIGTPCPRKHELKASFHEAPVGHGSGKKKDGKDDKKDDEDDKDGKKEARLKVKSSQVDSSSRDMPSEH
ncbi:MAG: hypothetical protein Q9174_005999 [Haloplaca sp. 1 TL-2023]